MARFGSRLALLSTTVGVLISLVGAGLLVQFANASSAANSRVEAVEMPVTAVDLRAQQGVASPAVTGDATTRDFMAAATHTDAPAPGCALQVSGTGGTSWWPVDAISGLPDGVGGCYTADAGFESEGRLVFAFVGMSDSQPPQPKGLFAVTSEDHAQTFSQPRRLSDVGTFAASVAIGPQGLDAAWVQNAAGDASGEGGRLPWPVGSELVAAAGDATGLSDPTVLGDSHGLVAAPTVIADPDGGAAVAYYQLPSEASTFGDVATLVAPGPWRLMVAHRGADDQEFNEPVVVAEFELPEQPELLSGERPSLAHPHLVSRLGIAAPGLAVGGDRTCVAWTDGVGGKLEAFVGCSNDRGGTWSRPSVLNTGMAGDTHKWMPQVAIGPSGRIDAVFYAGWDKADGLAVDVFYSSAKDPSDGFTAPVRLTSHSSHPQVAPWPGWFGTRLGLVSRRDGAVAMWADTRNGLSVYPSQTLVAAVIDTRAVSGPQGWVASGLLAVGLVMVLAGVLLRRRGTVSIIEPTGSMRVNESVVAKR